MNTKSICDLISLSVMCVTDEIPEDYSIENAIQFILDNCGNDNSIDIESIKQHIEDVIFAVNSHK